MKKGIATKFLLIIILFVIFAGVLIYTFYLIKTGGINLLEEKLYDLKNAFKFKST